MAKKNPLKSLFCILFKENVYNSLYFMLLLTFFFFVFPPNKQEPRHLQLLSDLDDSNIFTIITGRKLHNAPTDYQFCIKVTLVRVYCHLSYSMNPSLNSA